MSTKQTKTTESGTAINIRIDDRDPFATQFWGEGSCAAAMDYYKALPADKKGNWHQFEPIERPLQ